MYRIHTPTSSFRHPANNYSSSSSGPLPLPLTALYKNETPRGFISEEFSSNRTSGVSVDQDLSNEIGWMYETDLFEFDTSKVIENELRKTKEVKKSEHTKRLSCASRVSKIRNGPVPFPQSFSSDFPGLPKVEQYTYQAPVPQRSYENLGSAAGIVYSSNEFNHHSFAAGSTFTPLDNDVDVGMDDDWVDIDEAEKSEEAEEAERKVEERAWQESISVSEHKMLVGTEFAKPAISRADKKSSISSLKDLFKKGKKEQDEEKAKSKKEARKSQAAAKRHQSHNSFVVHKTYNHNDVDVSKLLPPPIKGVITPQGTGGLMTQTQAAQPQAAQTTGLTSQTTGPLTTQSTGPLTTQSTGLTNQQTGLSFHSTGQRKGKYQIKSTPIMNSYPATNDAESLNQSLALNTAIIRVPQSISEMQSLQTPMEELETLPVLKITVMSPQFYFVNNVETTRLSSSSPSNSDYNNSTIPTSPESLGEQLLMSPVSDNSDIEGITNQYLLEPNSPTSNRNSLVKIAGKQNNPFFNNRLSFSSKKVQKDGVQVNDPKTVTINVRGKPRDSTSMIMETVIETEARKEPSCLTPVKSVMKQHTVQPQTVQQRQPMRMVPRMQPVKPRMKPVQGSVQRPFQGPVQRPVQMQPVQMKPVQSIQPQNIQSEFEGCQTAIIPDEDINLLEETLAKEYHMKKQKQKLKQLQYFNPLRKKTSPKDKRMTCSLLYNNFSSVENTPQSSPNLSAKRAQNCHSVMELKHFTKPIGQEVLENRSRKSFAGENHSYPVSPNYYDFRDIPGLKPRKSFLNYMTCQSY